MVNDKELAALIAREIFASLDLDSQRWCSRIEGKATHNGKEVALGGYAEEPLADRIELALAKHRSY